MGKGNTTARGYGSGHQQLRAQVAKRVAQGQGICQAPICLHPTRRIRPGEPWQLGHTEDRTAYIGELHPLCNTSEGGKRGAVVTNNGRATTVRDW